ncbi:MAG: protein O-mannosyl-transferase [Acidobacteriota bacterium]|nr:protein O-mannosyl-transferase [Acidobacteriota bacterium]
MRLLRTHLALALVFLSCVATATAQRNEQRPDAPNVIEFFLPGGAQPTTVIRFTLIRDDGRVETLFTDTKGKYSMSFDLVKAGNYTVTVESDRVTYDTTTSVFRILRISDSIYQTIFLRPLKSAPVPRATVLDVSALDTNVPAEAQSAYNAGMDLIVKGQIDPGIESLKHAVTLYPQYLRAFNDLGVVYMKLNHLEEAADAFSRALQINSRFAYARLNLGITLNRQGKHAEAAKLLETLFKENPVLPAVRLNYADALYDAGRLAECGKLLRAGLEDPILTQKEKAELHYKLGRLLSREEKTTEAVKELQRAIELEPTAFNAHLLLGGNLIQLKRPEEAERSLLRAYELGGRSAGHAQLMLGQLYFGQKKYDLALNAFELYMKDVPDAQNAAQIKDVVTKLRASQRNR